MFWSKLMIDSKYAWQANLFLGEIRNSIPKEEKERLKELLALGKKNGEIDKWLAKYFPDEVLKFAQQTPQNRMKKKKWVENKDHFLLLSYFAYMLLGAGKVLISMLSDQQENGAYRSVCADYGLLFLKLNRTKIPNLFEREPFCEEESLD
jgi:hypothetical protein